MKSFTRGPDVGSAMSRFRHISAFFANKTSTGSPFLFYVPPNEFLCDWTPDDVE